MREETLNGAPEQAGEKAGATMGKRLWGLGGLGGWRGAERVVRMMRRE